MVERDDGMRNGWVQALSGSRNLYVGSGNFVAPGTSGTVP